MTSLATIQAANAKLPASYSAAKAALSKCEELDECQDWADKAAALASYAKQAQDDALERMAMRIKARAIKRAGELLKAVSAGVNRHTSSSRIGAGAASRTEAAREAGMSKRQKETALRVASVPDDEFEEAVEAEKPPTVTALAERGKKKRKASLPKNPAPSNGKNSRPVQELLTELMDTLADTLAAWPTDEPLAPAIELLEKQTKHYRTISNLRRRG